MESTELAIGQSNVIAIQIDESSLVRSNLGVFWGKIHIQNGAVSFPGVKWDDLVVGILRYWLEAFRSPMEQGVALRLPFMDGPYYVEMELLNDGAATLRAVEDRSVLTTVFSVRVDIRAWLTEVTKAAQKVVDECDKRGWAAEDIDSLRRQILEQRLASSL